MKLIDIIKLKLLAGVFWTHRLHLVSGCSPVSPGCLNCWMVAEARLRENHPTKSVRFLHDHLLTDDKKHFNGTIRFNEDMLKKVIRSPRCRVRKAWAVWTDLFHEDLFSASIRTAFNHFERAEGDYFIIVTKRPEWALKDFHYGLIRPMDNVIILVTMEDQERASRRVPYAMGLAGAGFNVGVLSEPLLSDINLCLDIWPVLPKWIITGGESGPGARPAHPDWFRSLRDQATVASVPFMFKGWGGWRPAQSTKEATCYPVIVGIDTSRRPASGCYHMEHQVESMIDRKGKFAHVDCAVVKSDKKAFGFNLLDGVAHLEVPAL